jgi:hypothetical protein
VSRESKDRDFGQLLILNRTALAIAVLAWHYVVMPKRIKQKRSKDVDQITHDLAEPSTAEQSNLEIPAPLAFNLSEYMSAIGRKGGKIGGKRRLKTMTSEARRKVAVNAAKARWKKGGNH